MIASYAHEHGALGNGGERPDDDATVYRRRERFPRSLTTEPASGGTCSRYALPIAGIRFAIYPRRDSCSTSSSSAPAKRVSQRAASSPVAGSSTSCWSGAGSARAGVGAGRASVSSRRTGACSSPTSRTTARIRTGSTRATTSSGFLERYAARFELRVQEGVDVSSLEPRNDSFRLETSTGPMDARTVVLTTGAYQRPYRPARASTLPAGVLQIDLEGYRDPGGAAERDPCSWWAAASPGVRSRRSSRRRAGTSTSPVAALPGSHADPASTTSPGGSTSRGTSRGQSSRSRSPAPGCGRTSSRAGGARARPPPADAARAGRRAPRPLRWGGRESSAGRARPAREPRLG